MGLGTAQFGFAYGVTNERGKVADSEIAAILRVARAQNVEAIDTAATYGTSEEALGQHLATDETFKIITKTLPINHSVIETGDVQLVVEGFAGSLKRLNRSKTYGLLVHSPKDLMARDSERLMAELYDLKRQGRVEKIGVSVYSGEEIDRIIDRHEIDIIQLPINVFDQRLIFSGHLDRLKSLGVEIHARSAFLQGLLVVKPEQLPEKFQRIRKPLEMYCRYLEQHGLTQAEGALEFLKQLSQIDCVIVGATTVADLIEISGAFTKNQAGDLEFSQFAISDKTVIDATTWGAVQLRDKARSLNL